MTKDLQESLGLAALFFAILVGFGAMIAGIGWAVSLDKSKPCAEQTK